MTADHDKTKEGLLAELKALRETNELLSIFVHHTPIYTFVKEVGPTQSRVLAASENYRDMIGIPGSQMNGKTMEELFPPDFAAKMTADDWAIVASGELFHEDETLGDRHYTTIKFPIYLGDRKLLAGYTIDISERKRAEEALKTSEEKNKQLADAAFEAVFVTDKDVCMGQNARARELFGYTDEEAVGRSLADWFHPDHRDQALERVRVGSEEPFEAVAVRKDGTSLPCEIRSRVLTEGGRRIGYTALRDITERRRTQEYLIQNEKMLSLGGLAAGMAHELNNPLSIILQAVQSMERRLDPDLEANREAADNVGVELEHIWEYFRVRGIELYLGAIREAGRRSAGIIRNMLHFSRTGDFRRETCDIGGLVDNVLELASQEFDLDSLYDFKKIKTVKEIQDGLPCVPCMETEIGQVLLNLLRNAAQAFGSTAAFAGEPTIIVRAGVRGDFLRLEVEDNGPGMTEDVRRRIFEPFYTTKHMGEGTGLGLSVSYFIITSNHDGRIEVESAPGEGTRFIIHLPLGQ